ncbi:hypothetical protein D3Z36_14075 [Lachnospiraceae bacterium]|nr:hypothetical protein [Lachnospiraceae bacterium]
MRKSTVCSRECNILKMEGITEELNFCKCKSPYIASNSGNEPIDGILISVIRAFSATLVEGRGRGLPTLFPSIFKKKNALEHIP